jgi:hypothetical protein
MKIREDITIELTATEVRKILKDHFSDKYDIDNVQFNIGTVYDDGMPVSCVGTDEVTGVRLLGKNKQK